ncbi:MAG: DciA family protein [Alphaproteobacteria bacterium]|nr:DciA family protein [Alphaproteobacteria bacterium]
MLLPRSIAATVDNVARQAIGKDWGLYAALLNHWREIVGEEYAQVTTPVKISFPQGKTAGEKLAQGQRKDGVLHIRLPQGLTMEFSFRTDQIRQRIAAFFGYEVISRIVFETYYGPASIAKEASPAAVPDQTVRLTEATKDIENNDLRAALEEFGAAVRQDRPSGQ